MGKKTLAALLLALAMAVVGYWGAMGAHAWSQTLVLTETAKKDDFGETVLIREWKKGFVPGGVDFALPLGGGLLFAAGVLLWLDRRASGRTA